jgi:hypothetical protein
LMTCSHYSSMSLCSPHLFRLSAYRSTPPCAKSARWLTIIRCSDLWGLHSSNLQFWFKPCLLVSTEVCGHVKTTDLKECGVRMIHFSYREYKEVHAKGQDTFFFHLFSFLFSPCPHTQAHTHANLDLARSIHMFVMRSGRIIKQIESKLYWQDIIGWTKI